MTLKTDHLKRCLTTLEAALAQLTRSKVGSLDYDVYRNAVIKGFELSLETSGQLLRRSLKAYFPNPAAVDDLTFKDVLRFAAKHRLMTPEEVERWFAYRDNRNLTAHDYGAELAEDTLRALPGFLTDARRLAENLDRQVP